MPAEYGMLDENIEIQTINQSKLVYPLFDSKANRKFLRTWLEKIKTIDFGSSILDYQSTTDGTYGKLTIKKEENVLNIDVRNFDNYKNKDVFKWVSELINRFGIKSEELFKK